MPRSQVVNIRHGVHYDVYIGRGGKGKDGKWGNPFQIGRDGDRDAVIAKYGEWLKERIRSGDVSVEELADLHDKIFGCFCAPQRCHGDILATAAEWAWTRIYSGQPGLMSR